MSFFLHRAFRESSKLGQDQEIPKLAKINLNLFLYRDTKTLFELVGLLWFQFETSGSIKKGFLVFLVIGAVLSHYQAD